MKKIFWLLLLFVFFALPDLAEACSVCFGDSGAPMVKAANAGIAFLLGVIAFVLTSILFVGLSWARRARQVEDIQPDPYSGQ